MHSMASISLTLWRVFAAACAESNEAYLTKVYALVTDGKLRVGVKEEARPAGHSSDWAIFDNFKITYRGTSEAVLQQCVTPLIEQANALLEGKMYEGAKSSLQKAVDAVNATLNMDKIKALALEIKNAQAAIDAYKPLATAIENVKHVTRVMRLLLLLLLRLRLSTMLA